MDKLLVSATGNKHLNFDDKKNCPDSFPKHKGIFFNLKKNSLLQSVLINTLLIKNNCFIDDLANLLSIDAKKLYQVWQGKGQLTEKKSSELVSLFYILSS